MAMKKFMIDEDNDTITLVAGCGECQAFISAQEHLRALGYEYSLSLCDAADGVSHDTVLVLPLRKTITTQEVTEDGS